MTKKKTPAKPVRRNQIKLPPGHAIKIKQNGMTRPSPTHPDGSPKITARVWQIADEVSARHAQVARMQSKKTKKKVVAKPATRQEVLAQTTKEKIPYHTFVNQFYQWRKFNGLFGRVRKDGSKALPQGPGHGQEGKKLHPRRDGKDPNWKPRRKGRPTKAVKAVRKKKPAKAKVSNIGAKNAVRVAKAAKKTKPKAKPPVSAPAPVETPTPTAPIAPPVAIVAAPEPVAPKPVKPPFARPPFPVAS